MYGHTQKKLFEQVFEIKKNTLQSNSALVCRENENNYPLIKGKELLLAHGLIPPAIPYSVKELGDSPRQSLWSLLNWRKEVQDDFSLLRSTLLLRLFCVFQDSLANIPSKVLGADRDTPRHRSVLQKRVLLGTFRGITATDLIITFASAKYCT